MKEKIFIIALILMGWGSIVQAQEVHGVETRTICVYDCPEEDNGHLWARDERVHYRQVDEWKQYHHNEYYDCSNSGNISYFHVYPGIGFEFTNLNSIEVSVEADLYNLKGEIVDSKSFVLKSKESYIWKRGNMGIDVRCKGEYYVKYKAYKLL